MYSIASEIKAKVHNKANLSTNMPAIPEVILSTDLQKVIKILKSQIENNNGLDKLLNQTTRDQVSQQQRKEMNMNNLMISNELKTRTKECINFKKELDKSFNDEFKSNQSMLNIDKFKEKSKKID